MKIELLKQLYALYVKYEKMHWSIKRPYTLLGHNITLVYSIDEYITAYSSPDIVWEDIIIPKASKKFFNEIERAFGIELNDAEFVSDEAYEIEQELNKELEPIRALRLTSAERQTIHNFLYDHNGKLKTWKVIESTYKEDSPLDKVISIRLSSDYNAVVKKNKPVEVGCQRIPIETIRKIVEEYDKL